MSEDQTDTTDNVNEETAVQGSDSNAQGDSGTAAEPKVQTVEPLRRNTKPTGKKPWSAKPTKDSIARMQTKRREARPSLKNRVRTLNKRSAPPLTTLVQKLDKPVKSKLPGTSTIPPLFSKYSSKVIPGQFLQKGPVGSEPSIEELLFDNGLDPQAELSRAIAKATVAGMATNEVIASVRKHQLAVTLARQHTINEIGTIEELRTAYKDVPLEVPQLKARLIENGKKIISCYPREAVEDCESVSYEACYTVVSDINGNSGTENGTGTLSVDHRIPFWLRPNDQRIRQPYVVSTYNGPCFEEQLKGDVASIIVHQKTTEITAEKDKLGVPRNSSDQFGPMNLQKMKKNIRLNHKKSNRMQRLLKLLLLAETARLSPNKTVQLFTNIQGANVKPDGWMTQMEEEDRIHINSYMVVEEQTSKCVALAEIAMGEWPPQQFANDDGGICRSCSVNVPAEVGSSDNMMVIFKAGVPDERFDVDPNVFVTEEEIRGFIHSYVKIFNNDVECQSAEVLAELLLVFGDRLQLRVPKVHATMDLYHSMLSDNKHMGETSFQAQFNSQFFWGCIELGCQMCYILKDLHSNGHRSRTSGLLPDLMSLIGTNTGIPRSILGYYAKEVFDQTIMIAHHFGLLSVVLCRDPSHELHTQSILAYAWARRKEGPKVIQGSFSSKLLKSTYTPIDSIPTVSPAMRTASIPTLSLLGAIVDPADAYPLGFPITSRSMFSTDNIRQFDVLDGVADSINRQLNAGYVTILNSGIQLSPEVIDNVIQDFNPEFSEDVIFIPNCTEHLSIAADVVHRVDDGEDLPPPRSGAFSRVRDISEISVEGVATIRRASELGNVEAFITATMERVILEYKRAGQFTVEATVECITTTCRRGLQTLTYIAANQGRSLEDICDVSNQDLQDRNEAFNGRTRLDALLLHSEYKGCPEQILRPWKALLTLKSTADVIRRKIIPVIFGCNSTADIVYNSICMERCVYSRGLHIGTMIDFPVADIELMTKFAIKLMDFGVPIKYISSSNDRAVEILRQRAVARVLREAKTESKAVYFYDMIDRSNLLYFISICFGLRSMKGIDLEAVTAIAGKLAHYNRNSNGTMPSAIPGAVIINSDQRLARAYSSGFRLNVGRVVRPSPFDADVALSDFVQKHKERQVHRRVPFPGRAFNDQYRGYDHDEQDELRALRDHEESCLDDVRR